MKVYIVVAGYIYEGFYIEGIFAKEADAKNFKRDFEEDHSYYDYVYIQEHECIL